MRIIFFIGLLAISVLGISQENDSSLFRKNKVVQQEKFVFIHAFTNSADTCLFNFKQLDDDGLVTYDSTNYTCVGYPNSEAVEIEYKNRLTHSVQITRDNKAFNRSQFEYNNAGSNPTKVKTFYFQTNDSATVNTTYYLNKKGKLDSSTTVTLNPDGSLTTMYSVARYDKKGNLIQLATLNEANMPIEQASYEVTEKGVVKSMASQHYGEQANFTQYFYDYNQDGQLASSYNTVNQKQEYFYYPNGLFKNILSYNPKGELESEYIFKYTYAE